MDVHFVDTTFRDGSQSLWASGMRTGMIEAVAEPMDRAGFDAVEVPVNGNFMKKFVRDLKEDPWEMMRMVGRKMPNTVKTCMAGGHILAFEAPPPRSLVELFYTRLVEIGALNRAQLTCNTIDQIKRTFPWIVPLFRKLGLQIVLALSYTVSPATPTSTTRKKRASSCRSSRMRSTSRTRRPADGGSRAHPASGHRAECQRGAGRAALPLHDGAGRSGLSGGVAAGVRRCTRQFPRWPTAPPSPRCSTSPGMPG